ncbi:MAG TPA: nucleotidyltransferase [Bacteroidia bacterium]|nr:nucleotidyltransferase [Bacteroidia bacterium]HNU32251.1 nucleotidyltransferase [Bacteroidia bacterium]
MQIDPNLFDFVVLLNRHGVRYLIVGGYALGFHGAPRYTGDFDIWIDVSEENADKMMLVLNEFPAPKGFFTRDDFLDKAPMAGKFFGISPLRIDILNSVSGINFKECYGRAGDYEINGEKIRFLSYEDFVANKTASGRLKDLADIEELRKNRKEK